jgi:imidazolonepropionase-like amidohydrolase
MAVLLPAVRMRWRNGLAGAAVALAASSSAFAAAGDLEVRCGRLIDGLGPAAKRDVTVSIRGGRIAAVAAPSAAKPDLDLSGYTCLPGLIDLHTHLTDQPGDMADLGGVYYTRTDVETQAIATRNALATLQAGFTSVRNVGAYLAWSDKTLRDAIDSGKTLGPRMQVVGFYITIPGGGGDLVVPGVDEATIPARLRGGIARGPEAFRKRAEEAVAGGADALKVIASGAVLAYGGVPGEREMTREEIQAVVDVAHRAGKRVAAHAHGADSVRDAIAAGADTIEHASLIDMAGILAARDHGTGLVMDIYNGSYIDTEGRKQKWPEEFLRKNLETTDIQRRNFTRAHDAGVILGFGTDASVIPHGWNARQFAVMVERGMTPMEAIQSATSVAAKLMGWEDRVGAIAVGRCGDLIAVRKDPLRDVRALEAVDVVVKGGTVVKRNR